MVKDHSDSCRHIGYSFRLAARVILYASSHRQDNTYHGICYTSRGALAGTRNSSMGPPHEGSIRRPIAPWANALTTELHLAPNCVWMHVCLSCEMSILENNNKKVWFVYSDKWKTRQHCKLINQISSTLIMIIPMFLGITKRKQKTKNQQQHTHTPKILNVN